MQNLPVSCEFLALLCEAKLRPDEAAIYIAAKLITLRDGKRPTIGDLEKLVGEDAPKIVKRMKKKKFLPKGPLDFNAVDQRLRDVTAGRKPAELELPEKTDAEIEQKARALVGELKSQCRTEFPRNWFPIQKRIAIAMLTQDQVSFEEIFEEINWIFTDSWAAIWLAPHCVSFMKVRQYPPKYRMWKQRNQGTESAGAQREFESDHENEWKAAANDK